ncbi:ssu ribosomal protein s1p [Brucella melitensis bv. 1 str. 16M]|uniref:30S ribosomal protein S1 n=28 Tax=Brucella TaxID=234 RepID=C0G3G0_9HYPH|nr:ssu ribosomal protein s1p [Brucella melitensis bv. 1 str. 16M]EEH15275.1 ribosomal protein S1 [Brucella ceti str. Cudo]EFG37022.1 30S ribosomal protein S1 [Brucella sp. NVSL 07-0026]
MAIPDAPGVYMSQSNPTRADFESLLAESFAEHDLAEGYVVKGRIVAIEKDMAIIDAGLKVEGRVPLKEFGAKGKDGTLKPGDEVEVYVERIENALGEAVLSREKARREESWVKLEQKFANGERVDGVIFNQVKGGFTVDLDGAVAFLPRSQVDIRPIRDVTPLMHVPQPFEILKMDKRRGNIVVSRRTVLEESRAEQRSEIVQNLEEGQVVEGVVKNITDYGAFVDLGGIDGLLHVTDMAWRRVNHPSEILTIGQTVKVQIIRINQETHRISLGMKQLESDPWDGIGAKYPIGKKITGTVTNITDYGAFVEIEPGIEGLIHVSEMSWTKKNVHPGKILSTTQEVEVVVLEVDPVKRRISLGLKQTLDNPWTTFAQKYPVGTVVEGEVKNKTEFGLFIGLDGDVDGMVHLSDLDWNRPGEQVIEEYNKGEVVKAVVLDVDVEKERISLGIKQLSGDKVGEAAASGELRKNAVVTCEVTAVTDGGLEVRLVDHDLDSFIRRSDLSRDRDEQRPERFTVGQKVDARVIAFDKKTRKLQVSIKALEIAEEKEAVAQYGSSDSGASLGDILGAALKKQEKN